MLKAKREIDDGDYVKLSKTRAFNGVINCAEFSESMASLESNKPYQVYMTVNDEAKRGKDSEVCGECPYRTQGCNFDMLILENHIDLIWCAQFFDKTDPPEESDEENEDQK